MTAEHRPAAAGIKVSRYQAKKADFLGKAGTRRRSPPTKVLRSIVFDDPAAVVLGKEPVSIDGTACGICHQRAASSATIGRSIAYAWLPADSAR